MVKSSLQIKLMKTNNNWYPPKILPSEIQAHRQVLLNDAKISESRKLVLNDLL